MLRTYQQTFNTNLAKAVKQDRRVIACLPTGGGKTVCFIDINQRAISRNKTVLIITESRKIFTQIQSGARGIEINAKIGSHMYVQPNKTYIAMAQTLTRRPFIVDQFQKMGDTLLIINDEAHVATATKLLLQLPDAMLIGFTATPVYANAKHLTELYRNIVIGAQVSDLIDLGYLCSYKHIARIPADIDKLKLQRGEYTEESQNLVFDNTAVFDGLVDDLRSIQHKKAMVFCGSISHCEDTYERLQFEGIKCIRYHSQHELSSYDLLQFESTSDVNICISCASLNKGYDFPPIDLVALVFKTTSLPRYLQSIGRASRISTNKTTFTCVDYGMNWQEHSFWYSDRPYETLWLPSNEKKKKKDTLGVASVKYCPECMAIIPASTQVCPYCAALLRQDKELQQGELVEVTEAYTNMVGRSIGSLSPEELAVYVRLKNKRTFGIRIAKAHEQTNPGWLIDYAKAMNYSRNWPYIMREQIPDEKIEFADIILK